MEDCFGRLRVHLLHRRTSSHPSVSSPSSSSSSSDMSVCPTPPSLSPSPPSPSPPLRYQRTEGTASLLLGPAGAGASLRVSSAGGGVLPAGQLRYAGRPRWPAGDQGGHGDGALLRAQTLLSPLGRSTQESAELEIPNQRKKRKKEDAESKLTRIFCVFSFVFFLASLFRSSPNVVWTTSSATAQRCTRNCGACPPATPSFSSSGSRVDWRTCPSLFTDCKRSQFRTSKCFFLL